MVIKSGNCFIAKFNKGILLISYIYIIFSASVQKGTKVNSVTNITKGMKVLFKLVLGLTLSLLFTAAKAQTSNLNGTWHVATATTSFNLFLTQIGKTLSGSHCSVQQNGGKIDCGLDETDISIAGTVKNPALMTVTFTSFFAGMKGTATIKKIDAKTIEWKIVKEPQGEFHIPLKAILTKE